MLKKFLYALWISVLVVLVGLGLKTEVFLRLFSQWKTELLIFVRVF